MNPQKRWNERCYNFEDNTLSNRVNNAVTTDDVTIKTEPMDIKSDILQDINVTVKPEQHDLQLPCDHVIEITVDVKSEPADVDDVCSSEANSDVEPGAVESSPGAAATKQEMDIGPTELQPGDMYYMPRPCKPEPEEDIFLGACCEIEDQPKSEEQLHTDTSREISKYKRHMNRRTRVSHNVSPGTDIEPEDRGWLRRMEEQRAEAELATAEAVRDNVRVHARLINLLGERLPQISEALTTISEVVERAVPSASGSTINMFKFKKYNK